MTREEIDRHVAGILALRKHRNLRRTQQQLRDRGYNTPQDYNGSRRKEYPASIKTFDHGISPVDQVFEARRRHGWLPRRGDD